MRQFIRRHRALLRAHGLIRKVPTSHRYLLTAAGQVAIPVLLATRNATLDQLTPAA